MFIPRHCAWGIAASLVFAWVASAADFKTGDAIEVPHLGKWTAARVVDTNARGEVLAEFEFAGRARREIFKPTDIRHAYESNAISKGRMWSDPSGKFRIKAALIAVADDTITLRKQDLSELKVSLKSLSEGDQKFVDSLLKSGAPTTLTPPARPTLEQFQDPLAAGWVTIGSLADATGRVPLQPDPSPEYLRLKQGGVAFGQEDIHDRLGAVLPVGGPDGWILAAVEGNIHSDEGRPTRVLWVSLTKQQIVNKQLLPHGEMVLDYHPPSRRLLTLAKEKATGDPWGKDTLTLWEATPTAKELKPLVRWNAESGDRTTDPWARVLDANTVVQRWKKQEYVGWDIPNKRVKYRVSQESFFAPLAVTSGGRKYLVLPEDQRVRVLDSASGRTVTVLPVTGGCSAVSVSEDGYKLAVLGTSTLTVWDLTSADSQPQKYEASTIGTPFSTNLAWIGPERIMADGFATSQVLFSLKHNLTLWKYNPDLTAMPDQHSGRRLREIVDRHLVYAASVYGTGGQRGLAVGAVQLPGPKVDEADATLNPETLYIIKRGSAVRLELKTGENDARVRAALEAKVQANGWTLSDTATAVLVAEMGQGQPQTTTYHMRGFGGQADSEQSVTVSPFFSTLRLNVGDKVAWQSATSTGPGPVIFLRSGQTAQEEVDKWQRPNVAFFENANIPEKLIDPAKRDGLGSTNVTNRGLVAQ